MNTLQLFLKGREGPITLYFTKYDDAMKAADKIGHAAVSVLTDDYQQHIRLDRDSLSVVLVSDAARTFDAAGEFALHQARAQARTNAKAQSDPAMRLAGSPRILGS